MIALRFSPRARIDLDGIWDHTEQEWGADQANAYLRSINQTLELLRLNPRLGRDVSDIRAGYFKFPTASPRPTPLRRNRCWSWLHDHHRLVIGRRQRQLSRHLHRDAGGGVIESVPWIVKANPALLPPGG